METPEHQEFRARQRFSSAAAVKSALFAGLVLFIMSGGGPWSTAGTMNAIMGRDVQLPIFLLALGHFLLAFIYVFVIGQVIYRLQTWTGVAAGVGVAIGHYAANALIFRGFGIGQHSPEGRTFLVHLVFGLIASGLYKAFAVPRPLKSNKQP